MNNISQNCPFFSLQHIFNFNYFNSYKKNAFPTTAFNWLNKSINELNVIALKAPTSKRPTALLWIPPVHHCSRKRKKNKENSVVFTFPMRKRLCQRSALSIGHKFLFNWLFFFSFFSLFYQRSRLGFPLISLLFDSFFRPKKKCLSKYLSKFECHYFWGYFSSAFVFSGRRFCPLLCIICISICSIVCVCVFVCFIFPLTVLPSAALCLLYVPWLVACGWHNWNTVI